MRNPCKSNHVIKKSTIDDIEEYSKNSGNKNTYDKIPVIIFNKSKNRANHYAPNISHKDNLNNHDESDDESDESEPTANGATNLVSV